MKVNVYLSASVTNLQVVPNPVGGRGLAVPRQLPPTAFEAEYIQVDNTDGHLSIRKYDKDLEMLSIHGFSRGSWAYFEIDGPPTPEIVKLVEKRNADAERGTGMGMHL